MYLTGHIYSTFIQTLVSLKLKYLSPLIS